MAVLGMIPALPAGMLVFLLAHAFSLLLDTIWVGHRAEHDKDGEIVLLHQQRRILQRTFPYPLRISPWEKLTLLVLTSKLMTMSSRARALSWLPSSSSLPLHADTTVARRRPPKEPLACYLPLDEVCSQLSG